MPARPASFSIASAKLSASIFCTNLMTSPPSAQPWQYHRPRDGVTLNDGVFSSWNGHSPLTEPPPAFLSWRYSPMTSSTGDRSRTAAMSSSRIRPAIGHPPCFANHPVCGESSPRFTLGVVVAITWIKPSGAEYAGVELGSLTGGDGWLRSTGVAGGAEPLPYQLDYSLNCGDGYVTRSLTVHASGAGWSRALRLSRDQDGLWQVQADFTGADDLPRPGADPTAFAGALDCDLGLSPLTNTMPVLRHGLLAGGDPV